jgi:hypothetical protein
MVVTYASISVMTWYLGRNAVETRFWDRAWSEWAKGRADERKELVKTNDPLTRQKLGANWDMDVARGGPQVVVGKMICPAPFVLYATSRIAMGTRAWEYSSGFYVVTPWSIWPVSEQRKFVGMD